MVFIMSEAFWSKPYDFLEKEDPEYVIVASELVELGIDPIRENVEVVVAQKAIHQHPGGFETVIANLSNDRALCEKMIEYDIRSIIHAEGRTVWDHVKKCIRIVNDLPIDKKLRTRLRLILFYHDFGKIAVAHSSLNQEATQKRIDKRRSLHAAMIGHETAELEAIENGLRANGMSGDELQKSLVVIKNHMHSTLASGKPTKTAEIIDSFAPTEEERKEITILLTYVLQVDGLATDHVELKDGKIIRSHNTIKAATTFDGIWSNYIAGKKMQQTQEAVVSSQKRDHMFILQVFGDTIQGYLRSRGVSVGDSLTIATRNLRAYLRACRHLPPDEIRTKVDLLDPDSIADILLTNLPDNPFVPKLKVFGEQAHRIERELYPIVEDQVITMATPHFSQLSGVTQLKEKPDFGDIDIIAERSELPTENLYKEIFGPNLIQVIADDNQDSILLQIPPYGTFHVDFIHAKNTDEFETKKTFYSKGYLSRMIARVARAAGYKYGVEGFAKRYKRSDGTYADFLITTRLEDGVSMLGFDLQAFDAIETVDDIVDFVQTSPFFDPKSFDPSTTNRSGRLALVRSPQARYMSERLSKSLIKPSATDKDVYFKELSPKKYEEYQQMIQAQSHQAEKQRKPLNGFVIAEVFGLDLKSEGRIIGGILGYINEHYPQAQQLDDTMKEAIARKFDLPILESNDALPSKSELIGVTEFKIPEVLRQERIDVFVGIIERFVAWDAEQQVFVKKLDAPLVDRFLVPYRSGPIALAGFKELIQKLGIEAQFPEISEVHGIGCEVYHAFLEDPQAAGLDDFFDISDYGSNSEEDREVFWAWIANQPPGSPVGQHVTALRMNIAPGEEVALLDDTYSLGTTSSGILPGMLIAALGRENVRYAIEHNQYIFPKNTGWIQAIIKHSVGRDMNKEALRLLVDSAKGGLDTLQAQETSFVDPDIYEKLMEVMRADAEEARPIIYERLTGRVPTI